MFIIILPTINFNIILFSEHDYILIEMSMITVNIMSLCTEINAITDT